MDWSSVIATSGTLVGVAFGFGGNLVLARRGDARAATERANALLAQVVRSVTSFEVEVDSFVERRTSSRAKMMAAGQAVAGIIAGAREGHAVRSAVEELRFARTWDLAEGDRLVSRLQAANAELYPALILLGLMAPTIGERADNLAKETGAYANAKDDAGRKAVGGRIATAINELAGSVRVFANRKWWRRTSN